MWSTKTIRKHYTKASDYGHDKDSKANSFTDFIHKDLKSGNQLISIYYQQSDYSACFL